MSGGRHDHNLRKMKKWRRRRVEAQAAGQHSVARLARAYEHWCAMRDVRKRAYAKGMNWVSSSRRDRNNLRVQQAKLLILMLHLLEIKRSGKVPLRHYETRGEQVVVTRRADGWSASSAGLTSSCHQSRADALQGLASMMRHY